LQIEGTKHWSYGAGPGTEYPLASLTADPAHISSYRGDHPYARCDAPRDADLIEQKLSPGDLLYLPPGTWHRARAGSPSLALTLASRPESVGAMLFEAMYKLLQHRPAWRQGFPAVLMTQAGADVPPEITSFLADRLAEVRELAETIAPASLATLWRSSIA